MTAQTIFPSYIRLEHEPNGSARSAFLSELSSTLDAGERQFESFSAEARRQVDAALSVKRNNFGSLDLGVDQLRAAAAAQEARAVAAREVAQATELAARTEGDYSREARNAVAATQALAKEEERAAASARSHVAAAAQVQAALNQTRSAVSSLQGEYLRLAQAEAASANGSAMLAAIQRETGAGLERNIKSARESAQAFDLLFQAQDARSSAAAQNFFNTALGIDAQTKSARESARAFEEMFVAQEKARQAEEALANSAAALRAQLDPMYLAQQRFDNEMSRADDLMNAGAISAREYAQAQQLARNSLRESAQAATAANQATTASNAVMLKGTTARGNVINSIRAERTAFIQLGQQMQDVTVQAQLGTNAFLIFAQQAPQAAFALSGLADSADKTKSRIGQFATFLSGPWGAAIFAATAVLGPFIYDLIASGDEADKSARAQRNLTEVLNDQTSSYEEVTKALREYNREQEKSREVTLLSLEAQARQIAENYREAVSIREIIKARIEDNLEQAARSTGDNAGGTGARGGLSALASINEGELARQQAQIESLGDAAINASKEISVEIARINSDASARIKTGFEVLRQRAMDSLIGEDLTKRLTELNKQEAASLDALKKKEKDRTKEYERLAEFGEDAAKKIANIRDRFIDIPPEVAKANRATRELDDIISDLARRKPAGFKDMIEEAEELKAIIPTLGLERYMADFNEETERNIRLQSLTLSGREAEAQTLQTIWNIERQFGPLRAQEKQDILDIVRYQYDQVEAQRIIGDQINDYLGATRQVRSELENLFSGKSANFKQVFKDLQARITVESIFGDALRQMDDLVKGRAGVSDNIDFLGNEAKRAGNVFGDFADMASKGMNRLGAAYAGSVPSTSASNTFNDAFGTGYMAVTDAANDNTDYSAYGDIVVQANKEAMRGTALNLTPDEYARLLAKGLTDPVITHLNDLFGVKFFSLLQGTLSGAARGYVTGGVPGAVLGGLGGLVEDFGAETIGTEMSEALSKTFSKALSGTQTGSLISGLSNALGIKMSGTGAQIGGAIGSFIPIPGGDIIGSIAGGLISSIFGSSKYGSAVLTGSDSVSLSGSNSGRREGASTLGTSVLEGLQNVIDELGGEVGNFSVTIGTYKDRFRVNTTGSDKVGGYSGSAAENEAKYGLYDFDTQEEAIAFAIKNAIEDGGLTGLRQSTLNLLKATDNLDDAVEKARQFEDVFDRLRQYEDPVGAAIASVNDEFDELRSIFEEANASASEWADLEKLYQIERSDAIQQATDQITGSLQSLYDTLTVGNSALPLREREQLARAEYDALAARVRAGDTTAYDDFSEAAQTLLSIERELYGSQQGYFDTLNEVTSLTKSALSATQSQISSSIANQDDPTSSDFIAVNDNQAVVDAIADSNSKLDALNTNMGTMISLLKSGNSRQVYTAAQVSNF
ncbi:hypothetical protein GRI39_01950 [Altererythrobacter indicus]|uniref:Bacteriophage tail tape measure N-terminal domain-containing protein n=1 Tax=Altericroceibacterium indicum TaxID=374177 RepID=A0A845A628_9SPHN|nr:hypothetical protein [Altericroceibacterium indicum]MXP24809.1 hypothetical protein [Altericroceibacterium indicum]